MSALREKGIGVHWGGGEEDGEQLWGKVLYFQSPPISVVCAFRVKDTFDGATWNKASCGG